MPIGTNSTPFTSVDPATGYVWGQQAGVFGRWLISTYLKGVNGTNGAPGAAGPANTLGIGQVLTGAPGSIAAVTVTGTAPNQTLNLTIPTGTNGTNGTNGSPTYMQSTFGGF
jgi:hypothetical protein